MDEDGDAVLAPQPLGEPGVVGVAVGEDDPAHLLQAAAEGLELADQVGPVAGQAGVDDGDALVGGDQVGGDGVVADPVQVRAELHGVLLGVW